MVLRVDHDDLHLFFDQEGSVELHSLIGFLKKLEHLVSERLLSSCASVFPSRRAFLQLDHLVRPLALGQLVQGVVALFVHLKLLLLLELVVLERVAVLHHQGDLQIRKGAILLVALALAIDVLPLDVPLVAHRLLLRHGALHHGRALVDEVYVFALLAPALRLVTRLVLHRFLNSLSKERLGGMLSLIGGVGIALLVAVDELVLLDEVDLLHELGQVLANLVRLFAVLDGRVARDGLGGAELDGGGGVLREGFAFILGWDHQLFVLRSLESASYRDSWHWRLLLA